MFCTKCGNKLEDGSRFCTGCGTQVQQPPPVPAPPVTAPVAILPPVAPRARYRSFKSAALAVSTVMLFSALFLPWGVIQSGKNYYFIKLIGGNNYPSNYISGGIDIFFLFLLCSFLAAFAGIAYSLLMEKSKMCIGFSIVNLILPVIGFCVWMGIIADACGKYNSYRKTVIGGAPVGGFLYIGLAIVLLVVVVKAGKRESLFKSSAVQ